VNGAGRGINRGRLSTVWLQGVISQGGTKTAGCDESRVGFAQHVSAQCRAQFCSSGAPRPGQAPSLDVQEPFRVSRVTLGRPHQRAVFPQPREVNTVGAPDVRGGSCPEQGRGCISHMQELGKQHTWAHQCCRHAVQDPRHCLAAVGPSKELLQS